MGSPNGMATVLFNESPQDCECWDELIRRRAEGCAEWLRKSGGRKSLEVRVLYPPPCGGKTVGSNPLEEDSSTHRQLENGVYCQ